MATRVTSVGMIRQTRTPVHTYSLTVGEGLIANILNFYISLFGIL